ncbi:hypothetical protein PAMP_010538 [Pampus punctatissimus]
MQPVAGNTNEEETQAGQESQTVPGCNINHIRVSIIMAITDFLAASDITSAINACKGCFCRTSPKERGP